MQGVLSASLPDEFDADKLESLKARMAGDIARFRAMMADRRNAPLARQVLRKLLVEPIRCIPTMRDGKRDSAIRDGHHRGFHIGPATTNCREQLASPQRQQLPKT